MKFKAYSVINEIELNKIAAQCNIPRKYTWEEPLILQGELLVNILGHPPQRSQQTLVFSFGCIVFINTPPSDENLFLNT